MLFQVTYIFTIISLQIQFFLPIQSSNRQDITKLQLTTIGQYGLIRKARVNIPEHYHTGIDIKRPARNYLNEPIFPVAVGKVISLRNEGPYAQIIIEHNDQGKKFWSLYEHVGGIFVKINETVLPSKPIARFMNKNELDKYGWQFDHFHLEILKVAPIPLKPDNKFPDRYYGSHTLTCYTKLELNKYFYDPGEFLKSNIHKK